MASSAIFSKSSTCSIARSFESNNHNFSDAREAMYAAAREALRFIERFVEK